MYYGVKCTGNELGKWTYSIIESETSEELFTKHECEAVFDDIDNAEAYKNWLE